MQQSHDTTTAAPSSVCTDRIAAGRHQGAADDGFDKDEDYSGGADGLAAIVHDESGRSGATSTDDDLRMIIERLRSSQRLTDATNQDCATLVRQAGRLDVLVATSKSLASE
jgi:hypothetical protein